MPEAYLGRIVTFYSYKGGTGRSMALANTAWLLASNGFRVLAVDWDLEAPGLQRYFHPFLHDPELRASRGVMDMVWDFTATVMSPESTNDHDWLTRASRITPYAVSLAWPFPDDGTIDFVGSGRHDAAYSRRVNTFDWGSFYDNHGGGDFIDSLRGNMRSSYDWILIDSRTGLSDTAGICTVQLPDVVVNCFTLNTQSIEGAAAVARSIRSQSLGRDIQILPVPMRVEDGEQKKLELGRDFARAKFDAFLDKMDADQKDRFWGDVEAPYKPFYAYEEILAVFGDRPSQEGTLLAAYERITSYLTAGEVTSLPSQDELERRRYLAAFERTWTSIPSDVVVSYATGDRNWAEWIADELKAIGFRATLQQAELRPGADARLELERLAGSYRTVALLSSAYVRSPMSREWWSKAVGRDPDGTMRLLVPIRIEDFRIPEDFLDRVGIDLIGLDEQDAREALRAALGRPSERSAEEPDAAAERERDPARYPGSLPDIWEGVPARNPTFTGRESVLMALRDRFLGSGSSPAHAQVLQGLGGVGKTQVAAEYVFRFGSSYDLVCWIDCDQTAIVRSSLAALAHHLRLLQVHGREPIEEVLDALRRGDPYRRWLLVFDNADRPEDVAPFIPHGPGHVVVTSRNQRWRGSHERIEMSVFSREESIELLTRRAPDLARADAGRLAEALGDLPLVLEHAGAWHAETGMSVDRYLQLLASSPGPLLLEGEIRTYPRPVARTWTLSMEHLRERMPVSARLAELCAFFGPAPISLDIFTGATVRRLADESDQEFRNPILFARAVRHVAEHALARVDQASQSLEMHRIVQAVVRDDVPEEHRDKVRHRVRALLAAADPGDPDKPSSWPRYALLRPHLEPSGAVHSMVDDVSVLVANEVRCLHRQGEYWGCRDMARATLEIWRATFGEDDERTLELALDLADSLRSLGEAEQARAIDEPTHTRLVMLFGHNHVLTLRAARALAGDLRGLGEYESARELDEDTYARYRDTAGPDDPEMLLAANNLAVSLRFAGDFRLALEMGWYAYDRRRQTLGDDDTYTLILADNHSRDLRECGFYGESLALAEATLARCRRVLGEHHPDTLRSLKNFAVSLRRSGQAKDARRISQEAFAKSRTHVGDDHPDTLAAAVNLVGDLCLDHDAPTARDLAEQTFHRARRRLGDDNLYTLAAANGLIVATRLSGDPVAAETVARQTLGKLRSALAADHPFALSCAVNLANCLYDRERVTAARDLDQDTWARFRERLGDDHPTTLLAAANLAVDLSALGETATAQALRAGILARLSDVLGPDHPQTVAARNGRRADLEIDPPPP